MSSKPDAHNAAAQKAYADHSLLLLNIGADPEFESLHSEPSFAAVVRKVFSQ
jgi:hypothetical protein